MTVEQKNSLIELYKQYKLHCSEYSAYGSGESCQFSIYENRSNPEDKNLTIVQVQIVDLSEDLIPVTKIINNIIEPDGKVLHLEDFLTKTEVVTYLESLYKINWNG